MACYDGPNPVKENERLAIWKWAKEHAGVNKGAPITQVADAINQHFFAGQAKPEWINDIISGRKTPLRSVTNEVWRQQYNQRVTIQKAKELSQIEGQGAFGRLMRRLWYLPRTVAVAGHGVVFPVTHAGDLVFRPASWTTFVKGTLQTYAAAFNKGYAGRLLGAMERDAMYDTGLRSGVDMGAGSHPSGLISRTYHGPAQRAWDALTVMRFNLWKRQMAKFVKPGMSQADVLDIGKQLATWANHATGSGKGPIAQVGKDALFGPKLTQAKLNRIFADPATTLKTFRHWGDATVGEKAAAWTRLSGATQYLTTQLGFLAVNAGVLKAIGSDDEINYKNPFRGDYMALKGGGITGHMPGMHTELRALAEIAATAFKSRKELRGQAKFGEVAEIGGRYFMAKLEPTRQHLIAAGLGQNWRGQPMPWSSDEGGKKTPRLTYAQYVADLGPIPVTGPLGFIATKLKEGGVEALDRVAIIKSLIIFGLGLPGTHADEDRYHKED